MLKRTIWDRNGPTGAVKTARKGLCLIYNESVAWERKSARLQGASTAAWEGANPPTEKNTPSRASAQPLAKLLGQEFARTLLRAGRWPLRNRGCRLVNERQSGTELIEDAAKKNGGAEAPPLDCIAQGPRWGHGPARSGFRSTPLRPTP